MRAREELPLEVLGQVLAYAGIKEGPSVTLVCKRWRQAFYKEPQLWSRFVIHPTISEEKEKDEEAQEEQKEGRPTTDAQMERRMAGKLRLLQRVAQHVHEVELLSTTATGAACHQQLRSMLSCLTPHLAPQLTSLTIGQPIWPCVGWDPSLDASLAALSQLRRLHYAALYARRDLGHTLARLPLLEELQLSSGGESMPEGMAASLGRLTRLRSLSISLPAVPAVAELESSLTQLSQLTQLTVRTLLTGVWGLSYSLESLTRLTQLQSLDISAKGKGVLHLPSPSALPHLTAFNFKFQKGVVYAAASKLRLPGGAHLQACRCFVSPGAVSPVSASSADEPSGSHAGKPLLQLDLDGRVDGLSQLQSLPLLVDDLVPSTASLHTITMRHCHLDASSLQTVPVWDTAGGGMRHLAKVQALRLQACRSSEATVDAAVGALLHLLPGLRQLHMEECQAQACRLVLNAVVTRLLQGLRQPIQALVLQGRATDLAGGAYLSGLHTLDISHNRFERPPAALAYATALTRLDIKHNQGVSLTEFASMRLDMPCLKWLGLRGNSLSKLPLGDYLAGLTRLDFGGNSLTHLPRQLAAATALRCLMLDGNRQLAVAEEDANGILLRLPHLRQLDLEGTQTAAEVLLHLRASAPHLDPAGLLTPQERPARRSDYASLMHAYGLRLEPRW